MSGISLILGRGAASIHSKAGARWLLTLIVATTLCFVLYVYHNDAQADLLQHLLPEANPEQMNVPNPEVPLDSPAVEAPPPPQPPQPPASPPSQGQQQQHHHNNGKTPWIDTPPVFDTSQVADYMPLSALPDRPLSLHPLLATAMTRFLTRPVLTHAQAAPQNEAACPRAQLNAQVNTDQLHGEQANWLAVDAARIAEMRRGALEYLEAHSLSEGEDALLGPGKGPGGEGGGFWQKKKKLPQPVVPGSRGVVLAAGNRKTVEKAIVCIKEMQKLGWPRSGIEVFHFEGELTDDKQRKELEELSVAIHMVSTKRLPGQWKNFELKAESILRSSFDEVLYLDSDNYPLSDLRALFESPLFRDSQGGNAVFWPDLNRDHPDNAVHRLLGIPCHDAWELDSGQVLISKSGNGGLNLAALYLAQYMAEEGGFWFSGGDKDTFRYAFLALGIPYTPAPRWLSLLGNLDRRGKYCGAAMLQYGLTPPSSEPEDHSDPADPAHPEPLFVHANLLKHQSGVRPGNIFTLLRRLSPKQDDVRAEYAPATALHSITGAGKPLGGRGLCSDITAFRRGADVETVETAEAFGGLMEKFEDEYFAYPGARPGVWR